MYAVRAAHAFDGERFLDGGATVLVDGNAIAGVEPAGYEVPADCPVTTYGGTLLPGLVDAHVHLVSSGDIGALERVGEQSPVEIDAQIERSLGDQAAAGVTTVRDLGDRDYRTLAFRDRAEPGLPRVVAAGPPITIPDGHCHYLGCTAVTPDELRAAVTEHADRGVDVIKVMASGGFLTPGSDMVGAQYGADVLRTLVDAAHERGLQVLAHAHSVAGMEAAVLAGVDGIEHATGVAVDRIGVPDELLAAISAAGIAVDPTEGNDRELTALMPAPPPHFAAILERIGIATFEEFLDVRTRDVARMRRHGVRVVPGVDAGAAPVKQHGNAWRAVTDLVRAGYPVADALAAGTSGAADACGVGDVTGSLRPGYAADLLVVDGDVRADPQVLGRPAAVWVRGEPVTLAVH